MIHLEILSSSDPLAIGLYEFEYDYVLMGRSKKNDLIFKDRELPLRYITLEIVEDRTGTHLMIRNLIRIPYFFVNGKKVSGSLKLRPNDVIAFSENKIKVLDFKKTKTDEDLGPAYTKFATEASELRFALEFIEEVLIEAEEKGGHV